MTLSACIATFRATRFCACIGAVLLALSSGATQAMDGPVVKTTAGEVEGATLESVTRFLGIPYAAPPVADLRWRPPEPAAPWSGRRQATAFGPDCPQPPMDHPPGPGFVNPTAEDCLSLNIWKPESSDGRPLPVMVWIHGGAWIMGAGSWPTYDGAAFARGGVILVTINYRLGRLGFFGHPALRQESPDGPIGNYGLLDQIAALTWVKRNIAAFGGDPANVTVFGESAGGRSVNMLLTSPLARGLIDKAIAQSGGGQNMIPELATPSQPIATAGPEANAEAWAASVGVTGTGPEALSALRALPVETAARLEYGPQPLPSPMIDGVILPMQVDEAFAQGRQIAAPYLAGANDWEQSLLQWLPGAAETKLKGYGRFGALLLDLYGDNGAVDHDAALARLYGDASYVAPARFLTRKMAGTGQPVWRYFNAYVAVGARDRLPGAQHGSEVALVFHNEESPAQFGESAADAPMAAMMNAYWIQFARTGNPNQPGLPVWPAQSADNDALLMFDKDGARPLETFESDRFDLLDRAFLATSARTAP